MTALLKSILFLICTLTFISSGAQPPWAWAIRGGGSNADKANDMDIDAAGNVYVGGYYNFSGTFGSLPVPSDFGKEGLLAKVSPNGTWTWLRAAIGGWDERVLGVHVDTVNNFVYATGTCWYFTDFGSCTWPGSAGGADEIFVAKFDLNGTCQWMKGAGGDSDDHGYDLVTDKLGNIYLTGFISDEYYNLTPAWFGNLSAPVAAGDSTAFVAKMSPSGNFLWVRTFEAIDGERDNRIAIDSNANVYITGGFWGTKNFGMSTHTSNGGVDIFVTKFDSAGNQQWVRTAGSAWSDRANSVTVDQYQNVFIAGEFRDRVAFGTDTINNHGGPGGRDIFVARITTSGNWIWGKRAGSTGGADRANRIVSDKNARLYIAGQFKGTAFFGNNITIVATVADSIQAFVAAMDTNGKWKWVAQGGGPNEDRGNAVCVDDSCHVYTTGFFQNTASFGPNIISATGRRDIFVARLDSACFEYVMPPPPVPVVPECVILFPNVLSPNGDGVNDIISIPEYCVKEIRFSVYNRWGVLLSTSSSPAALWDGMSKGKQVSEGTYFYVCELTSPSETISIARGFVSVFH